MKKSIFITVRNGSTRLPNKAMLTIDGSTTIEYVIQRMIHSKKADNIVLCTTNRKEDDPLVDIAINAQIEYFRGSEDDKLERWNGAVAKFGIDFFYTADGDDLFCDPELIDMAFDQFERNNSDFIQATGVVCGAFTYGIKSSALKKVCEIKDSSKTEMMWVYFTETGLFTIEELENVPKEYYQDDIRMTLDYIEDLEFFKEVIKFKDSKKQYLSLSEILKIIAERPEIKSINYFRHQEWAENQKNKISLKLKGESK